MGIVVKDFVLKIEQWAHSIISFIFDYLSDITVAAATAIPSVAFASAFRGILIRTAANKTRSRACR